MVDVPEAGSELERLVAVTALLRAPGGCPWDAEQTHESLVRYLTEETHELIDAIESGSREELLEELGDVLYQVVFHADIAAHTPGEDFTIEDVAAHMTQKMVGRHPHVFGDLDLSTAGDVEGAWDSFKAAEKPSRSSVLDGVPLGMPALALADKLLGKAGKVGVTVPDAPAAADVDDEGELGELLLGIVASARTRGLDPERALRTTLRTLRADVVAAETRAAASLAAEAGARDG
ncbi:MazG family protein [Herbiconiux moechotypicola]|uniref:NTP pyrophosphohydrolase MazG-like domain-containing protein n=1 Tax=Herbiconiux moechotypicola TaxID=637393 RepID=A0ABN3E691_9MICO|nr:MazG family protein [Herbiconiux moechotypicola]MCS5731877.1 MazG family protein [Herbiconiux moechotypicola]